MAHQSDRVWVPALPILIIGVVWSLTTLSLAECGRWMQTNGPFGGNVISLAIDPATPSTMYAGTRNGLYRSTDGGTNWTALDSALSGTSIWILAIDPDTPATLYAGTGKGVFQSTDSGSHWRQLGIAVGSVIHAVAVDPATPSTVYVGTTTSGVWRSTDRGMNWTHVYSGLTELTVYALVVDPSNPSTIYAGTYEGGVFRSTDRGEHWEPANEGLANLSILAIAIDPETPATLYAGTSRHGLYRSLDGASHWIKMDDGLGSPTVESIAIDPATSSTLYVATAADGVFRSPDRGMQWTSIEAGLPVDATYALAIDTTNPSTVFVGTNGAGVFRSADRGEQWSGTSNNVRNGAVRVMAIDPLDPATIYAGTPGEGGLLVTHDRGLNWTPPNEGLENRAVLAVVIDPQNPDTLYAGTGSDGVYRTTDGAASWVAVNDGLPADLRVRALAIDPMDPSTVYAGTDAHGVFRSTNGGDDWTAASEGLTSQNVLQLAIDPLDTSTLYDGTDDGKVFRSTDGGEHWDDASAGLPPGIDALGLVIDPVAPSTLYLAARSQGVYRTTDGGDHWTFCWPSSSTKPFYATLTIDPSSTPSAVYFGSELGVFRTTDGGAHWSDVSSGLVSVTVQYLAMDPETSSGLYAGTDRGVFRFEPSCTASFAQFGDGRGLATDIVLTNPSATATVSGTLAFTGDDGKPLELGVTTPHQPGDPIPLNLQPSGGAEFSIPAQGTVTFSTEGTGELAVGSAEVRSDGTVGGVVRFSIPDAGIAGVGSPAPSRGFIAPVRRIEGGIDTGVALYNMEMHPVTLELSLRNLQGEEVPNGRKTIEQFPAFGHLAKFIDELFPDADTSDFQGTLIVESEGGRLTATALETGTMVGQFTTLPVTPVATAVEASNLTFAQFGSGEGLVSDLVLVNPSMERSVSGSLAYFDEQGQPMSVGIAGSGYEIGRDFTIPPWGSVTISTDGAGMLAVGSARTAADGPLGGVVRFHLPGAGIAGVGASQPLHAFLIPVRQTEEEISTGIALENTGDSPITVNLTLRDADGTPVPGGTAIIPDLPAHGHVAQYLEELFPDADTQGFVGTMTATVSGGTVAATALELGQNPGEFTTLPVTLSEF